MQRAYSMIRSDICLATVVAIIAMSTCSLLSSKIFRKTKDQMTNEKCLEHIQGQGHRKKVRFGRIYVAEYDKHSFDIIRPHTLELNDSYT